MSEEEADDLINQAKEDFYKRLGNGDIVENICEEWFGLELDYLEEFNSTLVKEFLTFIKFHDMIRYQKVRAILT